MNARLLIMLVIAHLWVSAGARELRIAHTPDHDCRLVVRDTSGASDPSYVDIVFPNNPGRLRIPVGDPMQVRVASNEVEFHSPTGLNRLYPVSPHVLEWELVLAAPPPTARVMFPIVSSGLAYHYQPPLSPEEISEGAERADSVVGSYAVYHRSDHGRLSGKAFHIYRPRAWDMSGDTIWCSLSIHLDRNQMVVDIPSDFLAAAQYPVTVDPTFGFSAAGASTIPMANTVCYANVYDTHQAAAGERIVQFHAFLRGVGDGSVDMAVYDLSGAVPVNRLAAAVTIPVAASGEIVLHSSIAVSQAMAGGTAYCVAMGAETGDIRYAYDVVSGGLSVHTSSGTLPALWNQGAVSDRRLSIYVTYESGGEEELLSLRRRRQPGLLR